MDVKVIRENIVHLLRGDQAHMPFEEAVKGFPKPAMNTIFPNGTYSAWALIEHMRFTQHDILDFMVNPHYNEPKWPDDYWPSVNDMVTKNEWDKTVEEFIADRKKLQELALDETIDLTAKIPQGTHQTYLREFHLVADHNAYHLGELAIMRQTLNAWKK